MLTDNSNSSKKAQSQMNESEIIEAVQQNPTILNRPELQSIIVHQQKIHTGPLPAAEDIILYNQAIPNGGDRLMKMAERSLDIAEKQQQSEIDLRNGEQRIQSRGQRFAILVVLLFSALAFYIAYLGDTKTAALLMGGGLASIVAAFLYARTK